MLPDPPSGTLESDLGKAVVEAIRAYHESKKRCPRTLDDLSDFLSEERRMEASHATGLYERARKHVTQSNYSAGAKKRKTRAE